MDIETKLVGLVLDGNHFLLLAGTICFLWLLSFVRPVQEFLFIGPDGRASRWQWLIAVINLAVVALGVFLLGLTPFAEPGPRVMVVLIIAAFATASWEWAIKYLDAWIRRRFGQPAPTPPA